MISSYDTFVLTGTFYTSNCKFFSKSVLKVILCIKKGYLSTLVTLTVVMILKGKPENYFLINFVSYEFLIKISSCY